MIYIMPAVPQEPPFEFRSELFRKQQEELRIPFAIPELPSPQLPVFVADADEDPVVNPTDFFSRPYAGYAFCFTHESNLIDGFEDEIDAIPLLFQEFPFPPRPCTDCEIHQRLSAITTKFASSLKEVSLVEKLKLCEQFLYQFLSNFSGERPAMEKPLFACLEIALRTHFFNQFVEAEKSNFISFFNTQGKFPSNLKEIEDELEVFVTKNGFFISPDPFFHNLAPLPIFQPLIASFGSAVNPDSLKAILGKWKSGPESRTSQFIEDVLREHLNHALVSQQVQRFKGQFQETGIISKDDFNLIDLPCVKKQVLAETFGLCEQNNFSFEWLYTQVKAEKAAQLALPKPSKYFWSLYTTRSEKTCLQLDEKLKTLAWAEEQWTACCLALGCPIPVKPPTESETLLELYNSLSDKGLFYTYVYQEAVAAGIRIESWDRQFAEYNWNKEHMIAISMRAIKRCL